MACESAYMFGPPYAESGGWDDVEVSGGSSSPDARTTTEDRADDARPDRSVGARRGALRARACARVAPHASRRETRVAPTPTRIEVACADITATPGKRRARRCLCRGAAENSALVRLTLGDVAQFDHPMFLRDRALPCAQSTMPLMNAIARPGLTPTRVPSSGRININSKRSIGPVAALASSNDNCTSSVTFKSIAAATAVGALLTLATAGGASAAPSAFVGEYADPKHPGCLRSISGEGSVLDVTGTDGTPGCANGEKQKPWSLKGEIVKIPSKETEILIDFSPKGGPKNLLGKLTPEGGILFPDGNTWSKKQ